LNADEQKICYLMNVSEEEYVQAAALDGHEQGASALASALSADEQKICRLMRVSEEEYLQAKI
jgi:phage I-like protein